MINSFLLSGTSVRLGLNLLALRCIDRYFPIYAFIPTKIVSDFLFIPQHYLMLVLCVHLAWKSSRKCSCFFVVFFDCCVMSQLVKMEGSAARHHYGDFVSRSAGSSATNDVHAPPLQCWTTGFCPVFYYKSIVMMFMNCKGMPDICQFWDITRLFSPVKVHQNVRKLAAK